MIDKDQGDDDDDSDATETGDEEDELEDKFEEIEPEMQRATWWPTAAFESGLVGKNLSFVLHHVVRCRYMVSNMTG